MNLSYLCVTNQEKAGKSFAFLLVFLWKRPIANVNLMTLYNEVAFLFVHFVCLKGFI